MSLILRKNCQPILGKAGLEDLHVGIQNKVLVVKGPCGKVLVHVGGINFNTNSVTKAEIEFATELFTKFIKEHGKKLKEYMTKKQKLGNIKKPDPQDFGGTNSYNQEAYLKRILIEGKSYNISINKARVSLTTVDYKHLDKYISKITSVKAEADAYFKAIKTYNAILKETNDLLGSLVTCDI